MILLRQKQFNSKAAKVLNSKYLKSEAVKHGIKSVDPKELKHLTRRKIEAENRSKSLGFVKENANTKINSRSRDKGGRSYFKVNESGAIKRKRLDSKDEQMLYDHGYYFR